MTESEISHAIQKRLGREPDLVLYRNSVGQVKHGKRWVRYGLAPGSSDLIGFLSPGGRFFALEVKGPRGVVSDEQDMFLNLVRHFGGFGAVARSVDDAMAALERARKGEGQ